MTDQPNPCPFCGSVDTSLVSWLTKKGTEHSVKCSGCRAQGSMHTDADIALAAWENVKP